MSTPGAVRPQDRGSRPKTAAQPLWEPVRDWLRELPREDKRSIGRELAKVQFGWPVGMPLCRALGSGLWEIRASLPSKRQARVFFGFHEGLLIAVHAFIKKVQRTPAGDLTLAR